MNISIRVESLAELKIWFTCYVQKFKGNDADVRKSIVLKEGHTKRVCEEIRAIGSHLGLNEDELRLAEIIALLHDVGRFEQYTRYKTFSDRKSEDHAALGIRIIEEQGILEQFNSEIKNVILSSIKFHNRAYIPNDESETCLFFSRLIRDADKLDIWKVVTDYYHRKDDMRNGTIELDLPDTPGFSEEVYQDLICRKIVDMENLKNLNDFKLLQIGWIFDINFKITLEYIKERFYLEKIREVLPKVKEIDNIFKTVYDYCSGNARLIS